MRDFYRPSILKDVPDKEDMKALEKYYEFEKLMKRVDNDIVFNDYIFNRMKNADDFLLVVNAIYMTTKYRTPFFSNLTYIEIGGSIRKFAYKINRMIEFILGEDFTENYNQIMENLENIINRKTRYDPALNLYIMEQDNVMRNNKYQELKHTDIGYLFCYLKPNMMNVFSFIWAIYYTERMNSLNEVSDNARYNLCIDFIEMFQEKSKLLKENRPLFTVSEKLTDDFIHLVFDIIASILYAFDFSKGLYPVTDKKIDQERRVHLIYLLLKENDIFNLIN